MVRLKMKTEEQWRKKKFKYLEIMNNSYTDDEVQSERNEVMIDILFELKKIAEELQHLRRLP